VGQEAGEVGQAVSDRDDDRGGAVLGSGAGMGHAGGDEAVSETALGRRRGIGEEGSERGGAVLAQADDAAARDEDAAVAVDAQARVEREPQSARPPSSG
jgi:hypothetical protein